MRSWIMRYQRVQEYYLEYCSAIKGVAKGVRVLLTFVVKNMEIILIVL